MFTLAIKQAQYQPNFKTTREVEVEILRCLPDSRIDGIRGSRDPPSCVPLPRPARQ